MYVYLSLAKPGKPVIRTLIAPTRSSVTILYEPPADTDILDDLWYTIKYRKEGENVWHRTPETKDLSQTVTGLEEDTLYEFKVAARYPAGSWGEYSKVRSHIIKKSDDGEFFYALLKR